MIYAFLFGAYGTHNIALAIFGGAEIVHDTAEIAQSLLAAPVGVECAVACRLIGVEVSFREKSRGTMFECAEVAIRGRGAIETNVASYIAAIGIGSIVFKARCINLL